MWKNRQWSLDVWQTLACADAASSGRPSQVRAKTGLEMEVIYRFIRSHRELGVSHLAMRQIIKETSHHSCSLLRLMAPVREKKLQVGPNMIGTYIWVSSACGWPAVGLFYIFFSQPSFTSVLLGRCRALTRYFSEQWQSFHFPWAALGSYSFS